MQAGQVSLIHADFQIKFAKICVIRGKALRSKTKNALLTERVFLVAGRAGFEPATELPRHSLSRRAHSATLAPPQGFVVATLSFSSVALGRLLKPSLRMMQAEGVGFEPT